MRSTSAKAIEEIRIPATDVILRAWMTEGHRARRSSVRATQRGFTLLEVLIALVIAGLALGVLYNAGLTGLLATQAASQNEQAIARARSHLTLATHASPLVAGDWQGDDGGGFAWHLRVTPIASTTVRPAYAATPRGSSSFPLTLYSVTVWISWVGNRREVRLDTEQIGQGAQ
ncbi:MAG TPA: prepilin-type N-terminal cleavage/methylation domain-containing protein [Acetobacteraceae bacterium]|nr:prepilin-type N-terminal cleavage/methylation domain-containing protein [Acetobacteraceae bacterium]